ncbi:hypothetical protein J2X72_005161 [Phyllobacterium sp. 1468]|uniref:hypothetical protein n=1 Tax=Phyllobacterium sp. 1468 TaxID=2817759 RepID=UPI002858A091|nr:hypothetical protein [Phyllobacterium sp. 1468]MDR6636345.1 hypothetical protein [Phyllobacterium sp. 1468]
MLYSSIDHISSENDWRILEKAHQRACQILGRDPKYHPLAEQVARTVMMFFARGERDYGRLAAMTVKREINLFEFETETIGSNVRDMSMIMASRPKYFH